MGDRVLVTGGAGFLAEWQIVRLLQQGYDVRATLRDLARAEEVRAAVTREIDPGGRLAFVQADLSRDDGWSQAVKAVASSFTSPRHSLWRSPRTPTS